MLSRRSKAFTVIELLTCISIIIIVAAILQPVFVRAREAAKIAKSESNLKQIATEVVLYQTEYDGVGKYCDAFCMGLPPSPPYGKLKSLFTLLPPNSPHPMTPIAGKLYYGLYNDPNVDGQSLTWKSYAETFQDRSIIYCDPFNNPKNLPLDNGSFIIRRLIGVSLGGSIVKFQDTGEWMERQWWANHQKE